MMYNYTIDKRNGVKQMLNITTNEDINNTMMELMESTEIKNDQRVVRDSYDKELAKSFGVMFWTELTPATKKLYRHVFPVHKYAFDEVAHNIEGAILARQE